MNVILMSKSESGKQNKENESGNNKLSKFKSA